MGWTKLKVTVAAVLLLSNLLLLFCVISLYRSTKYLPEESLVRMSEMLETEGIFLGEDVLSGEKADLLIYEGELGEDYYGRIAQNLSKSTRKLSFNTPNGYVMTMENGDRFAFQDGFGIRYMRSDTSELTLEYLEEKELTALSASDTRRLSRIVADFLEKAEESAGDVQAVPLSHQVLLSGEDPESGIRYCVCVQSARKTQVLNLISAFAVKEDTVVGMSGEWCFSPLDASYSAQLLDQINILYTVKDRILEARGEDGLPVTIRSLELGYTTYFGGDADRFYLIPAWNLKLAEGETYTINALNGAEYTK